MVYNTRDYCVFGFCPSSVILGKKTSFRELEGTRNLLRYYARSRKVAGLIPDEVIEFFSIYLILPAEILHWGRLSI
jgi:hypothetical protein